MEFSDRNSEFSHRNSEFSPKKMWFSTVIPTKLPWKTIIPRQRAGVAVVGTGPGSQVRGNVLQTGGEVLGECWNFGGFSNRNSSN